MISVFSKEVERFSRKLEHQEDVSGEVQTMADFLDQFILVPTFFKLPFNYLKEIFQKSTVTFPLNQAYFILRQFAFILLKKDEKCTEFLKNGSVLEQTSANAILTIVDEMSSWEENKLQIPPEPPRPRNYSTFLFQLQQKKHSKETKKVGDSMEKQYEEIRSLHVSLTTRQLYQARDMKFLKEKLQKGKIPIENEHKTKMETLEATNQLLADEINEVKLRLETPISESEHKARMEEIRQKYTKILSDLREETTQILNDTQEKLQKSRDKTEQPEEQSEAQTEGQTASEQQKEAVKKPPSEEEIKSKMIGPEGDSNYRFHIPKKPKKIKVISQIKIEKIPKKPKTIFDFILLNDIEKIKELIQKNPKVVNERGDQRITPLHLAAKVNNKEIVHLLLENKADVNALDQFGNSPVRYAAYYSNEALLEEFKNQTLYANSKSKNKLSLADLFNFIETERKTLFDAIQEGRVQTCQEIFKKTPEMASYNFNDDMKPIHLAAGFGYPNIIELCLSYGADINSLDKHKKTPLHYAGSYMKDNCFQYLLDHGADYTLKDANGNTCVDTLYFAEQIQKLTKERAQKDETEQNPEQNQTQEQQSYE